MIEDSITVPYAQIDHHITFESVKTALGSGHYFPESSIKNWCVELQGILYGVPLELADGQMLRYVPLAQIEVPNGQTLRRASIAKNKTLQQILRALPRTSHADILFGDHTAQQLVRARRLQICDIGPYAQVYKKCGEVVSGYLGVGTTILPNRNIAREEPVVVIVREPLRHALHQHRNKNGWLYPALEAHIRGGNFRVNE